MAITMIVISMVGGLYFCVPLDFLSCEIMTRVGVGIVDFNVFYDLA